MPLSFFTRADVVYVALSQPSVKFEYKYLSCTHDVRHDNMLDDVIIRIDIRFVCR